MTLDIKTYRLLMDRLPDAFAYNEIIFDSNGKPKDFLILEANCSFQQIIGLPKEQLIGKKGSEVMPSGQNIQLHCLKAYEQALASQSGAKVEYYSQQQRCWYELTIFSVQPGYCAVIIRDITQGKQVAESLAQKSEGFKALFDNSSYAIVYYDSKGIIMNANKQFTELMKYELEEILGKSMEEIVNAHRNVTRFGFKEVLQGNKVYFVTTRYNKWGDAIDVIHQGVPFIINNEVIGGYTIYTDITKRKRAQLALKEKEARLQAITDSAHDAIIMMDWEGLVSFWNPGAVRIFGYTEEEALGQNLHQLICVPRYIDRFYKNFPLFQKTGKGLAIGTTIEIEGLRKDGTEIPVALSLSAIMIEEKWHSVGMIRDITEQRNAEKKILKYNLELKQRGQELELLYSRLETEINKARHIHERTLPQVLPKVEQITFSAHYQPAQKIGGDYYDVIKLEDKLITYVSDVTGHGIDGAMLSVFVKNTINSYLALCSCDKVTPQGILRFLNYSFQKENYPDDYFICIFLGVLDVKTREFSYVGMGFQDIPLVALPNGERLELVSQGIPITSAVPQELIEFNAGKATLTPGSTLIINTDGLTEQMVKGEQYGERLKEVFFANSHLPPQYILHSINEDFYLFNEKSLQGTDDITYIVMQIMDEDVAQYFYQLESNFQQLESFYQEVINIVPKGESTELFLTSLYELAANAIEHGNKFNRGKKLSIELFISAQYICATVEDEGEGFNWRHKVEQGIELDGHQERGRGIAMTYIYSTKLIYNHKGNKAFLIMSI